jgi:hypothetical protein
MAVKPIKNARRSLGVAGRKPKLPESEYRFECLDEDDYEDCFRYEITRINAPRLRTKLQTELTSIPADVVMPIEPEDVEGSPCARKHDLQERLEMLTMDQRPWLELDDEEKARFKASKRPTANRNWEPVQAFDRLDVIGRASLTVAKSGEVGKITLVIDWTEPDTQLAESFPRLVKWMRKHRGKAALVPQRRGRKSKGKTIQDKLFALAVWRCSQHGMTYARIWDFLSPLRKKLWVADRNKRTLGQYSKMIERFLA